MCMGIVFSQASTIRGHRETRSELEKVLWISSATQRPHRIGDSFLFSFFLLLLVCDSLFDVTRKAVGNMGYFPVAEDVCVADVSSVSGAALGLYNIVNCATPRDLESPQPHAPVPR